MAMMRSRNARKGAGLSWLLIGLGLLFLAAPFLFGSLAGLLWPFFVLGPGLLLFYLVKTLGKGAAWLTVPASMVSMLGLLLFYQNLTGHWESWAYAWSLIMPGSLGLGLSFYGDLARKEQVSELGEKIARIGLGIFAVGAVFFEMVLNISGMMSFVIPLLFIALGIYFMTGRKKGRIPPGSPRRRRPIDLLDDEPSVFETPVYEEKRRREKV